MKPVSVIIVDDEPLARERIRTLLRSEEGCSAVAECANGKEALAAMRDHDADLMFLDIRMPELDGVAMLEQADPARLPLVIFTTAFDEFAVKAFELNAVDYLLKPFTKQRFRDALSKAVRKLRSEDKDLFLAQMVQTLRTVAEKKIHPDRLIVRSEGRIRFIPVTDILWIESDANYLRIHTAAGASVIRETMTNIARTLDPELFLRLHRTIIVNSGVIKELQPWNNEEMVALLNDGTRLPIGRTYKRTVLSALGM